MANFANPVQLVCTAPLPSRMRRLRRPKLCQHISGRPPVPAQLQLPAVPVQRVPGQIAEQHRVLRSQARPGAVRAHATPAGNPAVGVGSTPAPGRATAARLDRPGAPARCAPRRVARRSAAGAVPRRTGATRCPAHRIPPQGWQSRGHVAACRRESAMITRRLAAGQHRGPEHEWLAHSAALIPCRCPGTVGHGSTPASIMSRWQMSVPWNRIHRCSSGIIVVGVARMRPHDFQADVEVSVRQHRRIPTNAVLRWPGRRPACWDRCIWPRTRHPDTAPTGHRRLGRRSAWTDHRHIRPPSRPCRRWRSWSMAGTGPDRGYRQGVQRSAQRPTGSDP